MAIKVLKDKREDAKRTLLQEAALMGQFNHPNVVKLCGVVTEDEPVSRLKCSTSGYSIA